MRRTLSTLLILVALFLLALGYSVTIRDESCVDEPISEGVDLVGEGSYTITYTFLPPTGTCSWAIESGADYETRATSVLGTSFFVLGCAVGVVGIVDKARTARRT